MASVRALRLRRALGQVGRRAAVLVALVAVASSAAIAPVSSATTSPPASSGPGGIVLLHHPYPDAGDPLGVPFNNSGTDAFAARYAGLTREGVFDFPFFVADGLLPISSIPNSTAPFQSTVASYTSAYNERAAQPSPLTLRLATTTNGPLLDAGIGIEPNGPVPGTALHLWAALLEDHVGYQPPAALSNGVTDHRFTVRAVQDVAPVDLADGTAISLHTTFATHVDDIGQTYVAAWLQNGAVANRFQPHEVVQATVHAATDPAPTVQSTKGVLVEVLSAVWCKPCLYGDLAAAQLVTEHGLPRMQQAPRPQARYFHAPASVGLALFGVAAGTAAAILLTRPMRRRS